jgi:hypothetical protein
MNKIELGETVELKNRALKRLVKSIAILYSSPVSKEFVTDFASEATMLLTSYLNLAPKPSGKVVAYGARNDDTKQRYLIVNFRNKFGKAYNFSVEESDVSKLKRKK